MGQIEVNALSVKLAGSFEAEVIFPGIHLDKSNLCKVVWFIHEDGGSPVDLLQYSSIFEQYIEKTNTFIIAPLVSHSLCTDMVWGTLNEQFLSEECPKIFQFMYPISDKPECNTVLGFGTGGYGALKLAQHHPEMFGHGVSIDGELDIAARCSEVGTGKRSSFIHQSDESLKAVFGDPAMVRGSTNDLYGLDYSKGKYDLYCDVNSANYLSNKTFAGKHPEISAHFEDIGSNVLSRETLLCNFCRI